MVTKDGMRIIAQKMLDAFNCEEKTEDIYGTDLSFSGLFEKLRVPPEPMKHLFHTIHPKHCPLKLHRGCPDDECHARSSQNYMIEAAAAAFKAIPGNDVIFKDSRDEDPIHDSKHIKFCDCSKEDVFTAERRQSLFMDKLKLQVVDVDVLLSSKIDCRKILDCFHYYIYTGDVVSLEKILFPHENVTLLRFLVLCTSYNVFVSLIKGVQGINGNMSREMRVRYSSRIDYPYAARLLLQAGCNVFSRKNPEDTPFNYLIKLPMWNMVDELWFILINGAGYSLARHVHKAMISRDIDMLYHFLHYGANFYVQPTNEMNFCILCKMGLDKKQKDDGYTKVINLVFDFDTVSPRREWKHYTVIKDMKLIHPCVVCQSKENTHPCTTCFHLWCCSVNCQSKHRLQHKCCNKMWKDLIKINLSHITKCRSADRVCLVKAQLSIPDTNKAIIFFDRDALFHGHLDPKEPVYPVVKEMILKEDEDAVGAYFRMVVKGRSFFLYPGALKIFATE